MRRWCRSAGETAGGVGVGAGGAVEAGFGHLDEEQVGDDHGEESRKKTVGSGVKPRRWARPV